MSKNRVDMSVDDGSYVVKKNKRADILAAILCILVALLIWFFSQSSEFLSDSYKDMPDDNKSTESVE